MDRKALIKKMGKHPVWAKFLAGMHKAEKESTHEYKLLTTDQLIEILESAAPSNYDVRKIQGLKLVELCFLKGWIDEFQAHDELDAGIIQILNDMVQEASC